MSRSLKLRLTETAEGDLAEIWAYLWLEASEAVAERWLEAMRSEFDRLVAFPHSGPAREQLAPGLRVMVHRAYAIYYTPTADELVVVRVLHGARDVAALAARGEFE